MAPEQGSVMQSYRKHFIPLESNPEVFTELIHKLGVSDSLCFQDVLSLDDPEALAFIPRPVYALVLVLPTTEAYEKKVVEEEAKVGQCEGEGDNEDVVFFKQTINNACGLYAILHATCNGEARNQTGTNSILAQLLKTSLPLAANDRALALEESKELEDAYAAVAKKGDTTAPDNAEDEVDYHYICFVKSHKNGALYQLDGDRKRPIELGSLASTEDIFSLKCRSIIRSMMESQSNNLNFSLMALVQEHDM